jgi:hypothetical protein
MMSIFRKKDNPETLLQRHRIEYAILDYLDILYRRHTPEAEAEMNEIISCYKGEALVKLITTGLYRLGKPIVSANYNAEKPDTVLFITITASKIANKRGGEHRESDMTTAIMFREDKTMRDEKTLSALVLDAVFWYAAQEDKNNNNLDDELRTDEKIAADTFSSLYSLFLETNYGDGAEFAEAMRATEGSLLTTVATTTIFLLEQQTVDSNPASNSIGNKNVNDETLSPMLTVVSLASLLLNEEWSPEKVEEYLHEQGEKVTGDLLLGAFFLYARQESLKNPEA